VEEVDVVMASMPEADFTNILHEPFTCKDPKSAKKSNCLTVFFALMGSASEKMSRKMLVKLTPGEDDGEP
jgi:hypothetical protein